MIVIKTKMQNMPESCSHLGPYTIECYYNETLKMENIHTEEEK